MRIEQRKWSAADGWASGDRVELGDRASLVLAFAGKEVLRRHSALDETRAAYPEAIVVGCSTAGEIAGTRVSDDSLVSTAVELEQSSVRAAHLALATVNDSYEAGRRLALDLPEERLAHVVVIADGTMVNGSALVRGLNDHLPTGVQVTGGLAGDGESFEETLVFLDSEPRIGLIAAIGFYGDRLRVGFGSLGGWDPFGPDRLITRSEGNVLFELDGKSALGLYRNYLGEYARELPASALLFPLALRREGRRHSPVVRTILSIDDEAESMTFAGDMPQGEYARLMKANFERLIDGATLAAKNSFEILGGQAPDLALLISCVGRRMVLKQRTEEEVESVREVLGPDAVLTGFYSYGEISPFTPSAQCELHNQTMTVTTLSER
jgi:hypothetical protein